MTCSVHLLPNRSTRYTNSTQRETSKRSLRASRNLILKVREISFSNNLLYSQHNRITIVAQLTTDMFNSTSLSTVDNLDYTPIRRQLIYLNA
jgi:hypothetical protein